MYYYRAVRIDGRPRRIYLGSADIGRIHELLDRRQQRKRLAILEECRRLKADVAEFDRIWKVMWGWTRAIACSTLLLMGWYSHHGSWRKVMAKPRKRHAKQRSATPQEAADLQTRLIALNERANTGDNAALAELRAFLDEHPEVWQTVGDLSRMSVDRWTALVVGNDTLHRESIKRSVASWKAKLVGPDSSPTELALADTAVAARLALIHAESQMSATEGTLKSSEFAVKRLDSAVHRLNATLKLLAQVRAAYPSGLAPVSSPVVGMPRLYVEPGKRRKAS